MGPSPTRSSAPSLPAALPTYRNGGRVLFTVEEHQRCGGFGSAVLEAANRHRLGSARVRLLAVEDQFVDHATTRDEQLAAQGLDAAGIARAVRGVTARVREGRGS